MDASSVMKFPTRLILLQGLWAMLLHACHLDLAYPNSSPDLLSFLDQSPCSSLSLDFPPTSSPVVFVSMGNITFLRLNCYGVSLVLQTTLLIQPEAEIWLSGCTLMGRAGLGLIDIQGNMTLQDCNVGNHSGYAFLIEGRVLIQRSVFEFNHGSVFLASQLGINLTVRQCLFEHNESPLGTILHLSVISLNALSTTLISFEDSTFNSNSAALGGSFMHVSIERSDALNSSAVQQRQLLVKNCQFSDNSGSLWHLFLTYMQTMLVNNTITNATVPLYLQLYDNSLLLENTTITSVEKVIVCAHLNGSVFIRNLRVYNSSEGPALIFSHTAPSSPGQVTLSNLEMRYASQTDFSRYTSTLYILNVPVTVENFLVQESFSFASACGAFFFTESSVTNCTFADSFTHQGGLIGHVGGQGTASRLLLRNVTTEISGAVLTMQARVNFSHVYFFFDNSEPVPLFSNLLVFLSSVVVFSDVDLNMPMTKSELIIKVMLSEVRLIEINFKILHMRTFFQSITSNVTLLNVSAEAAELNSFALIYAESRVNISQVVMRNWVIREGLITAKTSCIVELSHIEIYDSLCESLVRSFYSQVHLNQIVLNHTQVGTLFSVYIGGEILMNDLQISHLACNLVLCESGLFAMAGAQLKEVTVLNRLITLRNSTANLQSIDITGLYATTVSPLVIANTNSTLQLFQSSFQQIKSREQGLMQLTSSRLLLSYFSLSYFNASFAALSKCRFTIVQTQAAHGGAQFKGSGFIRAEDSQGLVSASRFHSVHGVSGGVFAFVSSTVGITNVYFNNCSAQKLGGVMSAESASLKISHCTFYGNSAPIGGVIYFQCDTESKCPAVLEACEFESNSAVEGAVLKWTQVKPVLANLTNSHNTAVYGDFEASLPTHIALVGNTSTLTGVAGIRVVAPIVIASLDSINQTVLTDNGTIVQLISESLRGTTYLPTVNGFASFSGVIVDTTPGSSIQIQAFSPSIQQTFPTSLPSCNFTYQTRKCVSGEISLPLSCFLCPKNTYSLFPSDTYCHDCPHYASCPGGNVLVLDSGYWRASELSTEVWLCPNPDACEGGLNATCSAGYSGELCSACAVDYYMLGTVSCQKCEGVAVILIRSFIICLFVVGVFIYLSNQTNLKSGQLASIRIIANFLHFLLVLPLIPVNWKEAMTGFLSFTEMVVSFGQTSLSIDCWTDRATYSAVYWKAVVATAFPVLFFFLVFATSCVQDKCISGKQVAKAIAVTTLLLWWTQPYVLKAVVTIFSCKRQVNHWILGSDPALSCWEGAHLKFALALSLPALLLYGVAYQVCFYLILRHRALLSRHKITLHFYTSGLEKKYRLWEAFNALKKEALIVATAVLQATDNVFQVLIVALALYVALTCFIASKEHQIPVLHRLAGFGLLLEVYFSAFSYYFVARLGLNSYLLTLLSCLTTTVAIVFLLVCFVQIRRLRIIHVAVENREVPQESNEEEFYNESPFVPPQSPASLPTSGIQADSISIEISATH